MSCDKLNLPKNFFYFTILQDLFFFLNKKKRELVLLGVGQLSSMSSQWKGKRMHMGMWDATKGVWHSSPLPWAPQRGPQILTFCSTWKLSHWRGQSACPIHQSPLSLRCSFFTHICHAWKKFLACSSFIFKNAWIQLIKLCSQREWLWYPTGNGLWFDSSKFTLVRIRESISAKSAFFELGVRKDWILKLYWVLEMSHWQAKC